jgi:hypothetical protein
MIVLLLTSGHPVRHGLARDAADKRAPVVEVEVHDGRHRASDIGVANPRRREPPDAVFSSMTIEPAGQTVGS